jgi:hypothetical protein
VQTSPFSAANIQPQLSHGALIARRAVFVLLTTGGSLHGGDGGTWSGRRRCVRVAIYARLNLPMLGAGDPP